MMTPVDLSVRVVDVEGEHGLGHARRLFLAYAAEHAPTIAESLCVQGFEAELAGLPGRYAPPSGRLLLAMAGDEPVGCVALRDLGDRTCEMKRLYVAPEGRGRGVGRRLVEAVIHRAERAGYRRMVLDTLPEMADAVALYRRCGFVETARYWDNLGAPPPGLLDRCRRPGAVVGAARSRGRPGRERGVLARRGHEPLLP
jgi:putative acetyltransferase